MNKQRALKCDVITFDEFIDIITDNRGEEITKQIREIELKKKRTKNRK